LPPSKGAITPLRLRTEVGGRTEETDMGNPFCTEGMSRIGRIVETRNGRNAKTRKRTNDPTVHPARGIFDVLRQVSWLADRCGNPVFPPRSGGSDIGGLQLFAYSCGGSAGMVKVTGPASLLAPDVVSLGNRNATDCSLIAVECQARFCHAGGKNRRKIPARLSGWELPVVSTDIDLSGKLAL
jgi:hypothetical protein